MSYTMKLLEERHMATKVELMVWSHKLDLLALSNAKGEVALHRLSWQKVWSLPPPEEGASVKVIAWRPDGKVIAIAYSSNDLLLVGVENRSLVHRSKTEGEVTCLSWTQDDSSSRSSYQSLQDLNLDFLPRLPSLSRSYGSALSEVGGGPGSAAGEEGLNGGGAGGGVDSDVTEPRPLSLLIVGHVTGQAALSIYGLFGCGSVDCGTSCILSTALAQDFGRLVIVCEGGELKVFDTSVLAKQYANELHALASKHLSIMGLVDYLDETMKSVKEAYENLLLLEMESKLASYAESTSGGDVSADLLELLVLGSVSESLQRFLHRDLSDKAVKKLGHSIELSYSNIQKLVLKHVHSVAHAISYHLAELQGMARCSTRFRPLGLNEDLVTKALSAVGRFLAKANEMLLVIDDSMKKYKLFFRWLFAMIQRVSEDRMMDMTLADFTQQDIAFIASFIYDLDGSCRLDHVGQYLNETDLTHPIETENSWQKLLKNNEELAKHPCIVKLDRKTSLMQEHVRLREAIVEVFVPPQSAVGSMLLPDNVVKLPGVKNPSQVALTLETGDNRLLLTTLEGENLLLFDVNLVTKGFSVKSIIFPSLHPLDVQFYVPEILSVLLKGTDPERGAVFVQLPVAPVCKVAGSEVDATNLVESSALQPIENLVASSFAVSGARKMAVLLSESRRKIRLYDLDAEAEDEEEEGAATDADSSKCSAMDESSLVVSP
ncbi:anaphase-promoting complex subunit 4 [Nilaparvata lugens]|uniref:anaphase-promoting complex subunit 4 n=1 Tax=Nilaparvata lugens TaxID=108931 RepID=UPI000B9919ED|nr:anaphase-promoting complex subunit 4 [Nilaparvata lugens]